jgi:hypothetical protein
MFVQVLVDGKSSHGLTLVKYPLIVGKHVPATMGEVSAVVEQLNKLHELRVVHGDVRAFNIVFGAKSRLIDFDFAGMAGLKRYPAGFKSDLNDTERHTEAKENQLLEKQHDNHSLAWILSKFKPKEQIHSQAWSETILDITNGNLQGALTRLQSLGIESLEWASGMRLWAAELVPRSGSPVQQPAQARQQQSIPQAPLFSAAISSSPQTPSQVTHT